jgi:chaperonin GroES
MTDRSGTGRRPSPHSAKTPRGSLGAAESPSSLSNDAGRVPTSKEECTLATATASTTKLRPLGDRVVIQPTPREDMTKSGIVLPDTAKEKPQEGLIVAAGPGRVLDDGKREAMDIKKGDKVLYAKYAGTEFKIDGEELLIVSQKDILAVVED